MATDSKKKGLGLPQTKGSFQVRGKVIGTKKEKFYTEKLAKNDKPWRAVSFGVQFDEKQTMFVDLNGMEKDEVYFTRREDKAKGIEKDTKKVPWRDRLTFAEKDYSLIGMNVGVKKVKDEKGNDVNDKKRLVDYDACKEIADNLTDDKTVFVRGSIEFGSYNNKHTTKFVPNQVSLAKDIDFNEEDFTPLAGFTQTIVYTDIKQNEEKTKATVAAKIINFDTVEDAEFVINDMNLARVFKKNLKPYSSIKVWGDVCVVKNVEEVTTTDCWGSENKMEKQNAPTVRELVITGADPESIDTTTYTEAEIDKAIEAMKASKNAEKDFGSSTDGWGSVQTSVDSDDMDCGW